LAAVSEPTLSQRVRLSIYQHFLEHSRPPIVEELMTKFGLSRPEVVDVLCELVDNRSVAVVKGTSRVLMAWPFSAIATPFSVHAGGRDYFANCSWDAIAFHSMLGNAPIQVDSFCHHCARAIRIELDGGRTTRVDPETTIVYLALRPAEWWEDIITTCSNTMVFFCSAEHRDASGLTADADKAASLTPQQTHDLGVPLYQRRLEIDYVRPGRDELNAHFASLGLGGPYWRI
jgi:hypothetical protein